MNHKEVALRWISRPEEIVRVHAYNDMVTVHLEGFRRVEITVAGDRLEYYTREGENEK